MMDSPTRPPTICFFSHSPCIGGAELSLLELVRELTEDGAARCHVVLPGPGPLQPRLEAAGATTEIVASNWWCHLGEVGEDDARDRVNASMDSTLLAVATTLRVLAPDVICTNTLVLPWGAVAAALLGRPHLWHVHEFGVADHELQFFQPLPETLRWMGDASARIITNSKAVREALFARTPADEKCVTIYNHVAEPSDARGDVEHFHVPGAFRLLMLGTLCPGKGQRDAVLAIQELVGCGANVELLLAGNVGRADYQAGLDALVRTGGLSERVRIVEFLDEPHPALVQADALLVCSRQEAFGRVALEAMLLGKPVIATRAGGLPELVEDGTRGLLYEPGNVAELAEKILVLENDRALGARLGAEAQAWARKTFTREAHSGRVASLAREVVQEWESRPSKGWDDYWRKATLGAFDRLRARWQEEQARLSAGHAALAASMERQAGAHRNERQAWAVASEAQRAQQQAMAATLEREAATHLEQHQALMASRESEARAHREQQQAWAAANEAQREQQEALVAAMEREAKTHRAQQQALAATVESQATVLHEQQLALAAAAEQRSAQDQQQGGLRETVARKEQELAHWQGVVAAKERALSGKVLEIAQWQGVVAARDQELARQAQELANREQILAEISRSRAWKLVQVYAGLRDRLAPVKSRRRRIAKPLAKGFKRLVDGLWGPPPPST